MRVFDRFTDARPAGRTLGTLSTSGAPRRGVDREGCIAIDHGALRFQPLVLDGWNRQGVSYGPVAAGQVAFSVGLLNGHNTSHAGHLEQPVAARLSTWLAAGGNHRTRERILRFLRNGRHGVTARQLVRWLARAPRLYRGDALDENLAVGFFEAAAPTAPQQADVGFLMHAAGPENGELWARVAGRNLPVLRGVQNVPLWLAIVRREHTATYYVSSSEAARGLPRMPFMRPVAVTPHRHAPNVFPGVQQSVLGQAGFRVDTRIYGIHVVPWEGVHALGILAWDSLTAPSGALEPPWQWPMGSFERSERGIRARDGASLAWLDLPEPAGLVHVLVEENEEPAPALLFGSDVDTAYALQLEQGKLSLRERALGATRTLAEAPCERLGRGVMHSLSLVYEAPFVVACLDGRRAFELPLDGGVLSGVGIFGERRGGGHLRSLEVHARAVPIPEELSVPLPSVHPGSDAVVDEEFEGAAGELTGREARPGAAWRKELGRARIVIERDACGAVVTDARRLTSGGRTVYTLPWEHPEFADLAIAVKPPGERRGQGHEGRAGVVFWQDEDNYVIVGTWLHDHYGGASISSFYCLRGFEDVYEAVWTNVGGRVRWGVPYELRVAFDGERFTATLDGEAVLHRALSDVRPEVERLAVRRVGIVANWEWGNDTGSVFRRFLARRRNVLTRQLDPVVL